MALTQPVIDRLKAEVDLLQDRVDGAAEFADLIRNNRLPQVTPAASVLPLGLSGGRAESMAGMFTQMVAESIAVILTVRSGDRHTTRGQQLIDALIEGVTGSLCGWAPGDDTVGVFEFTRGQLVSVQGGAVVYQLDFTLSDQLRIAR